jgi:Uma2 family endonuclease
MATVAAEVVKTPTYTSAAFWEFVNLPENQHKMFERRQGKIVAVSPSNIFVSAISIRIAAPLHVFVEANGLGVVTGEQGGCDVTSEDTFAPDVAFVSKARVPAITRTGFAPIAPDLAVEVVSPSNTAQEIHSKVLAYLKGGTKLVLVAYPDTQTIAVHTDAGSRTLTANDTFDGGEVLPGFTLPVRNIFPEKA